MHHEIDDLKRRVVNLESRGSDAGGWVIFFIVLVMLLSPRLIEVINKGMQVSNQEKMVIVVLQNAHGDALTAAEISQRSGHSLHAAIESMRRDGMLIESGGRYLLAQPWSRYRGRF